MSYAALHFWQIKAECLDEHAQVMAAIVRAERDLCPEVLLNLTFGPSETLEFVEVQLYPDKAAADAFPARVGREAVPLQRLWERQSALIEPGSSRSQYFEASRHLPESFVLAAAQIGGLETQRGRLAGKIALVTGATRGNGFGIARALAAEGARVALSDLPGLAGETQLSANRLRDEYGTHCLVAAGDVTDESAVEAILATTAAELGGLDILVNNAGVFPFKPVDQFTAAEYARVLAVNVTGPWLLSKHALPHLQRRGGGAIINITSCSGHYGGASSGGSAYDASKAALRQMTTSLAVEYGPHHVRVNAVAPGVIATEAMGGVEMLVSDYGRAEIARTPLGRLGRADDIGAAAAFLASADASFITGITLILDGGAMAAW